MTLLFVAKPEKNVDSPRFRVVVCRSARIDARR
jgi:hypothetical protein